MKKKKLKKINKPNNYKNLFLLLKNSSLLTLPSVIGILLALFSIPIHLQINGKVDYGNYIFFHFIIFFGLLLNFGINKIVTIELAKNKEISKIIKQGINFSIYFSIIIFFIGILFSYFTKNFYYYSAITFGLCLTIIYLTLDGILQGLKKFKSLSMVNFIFYTISLNIPSISLIYKDNSFEKLIIFSILVKVFAILICIFILKPLIKGNNISDYNFLSKLKKYSKWYLLFNLNIQVFDILDKYLIKIFIGPAALAIYSIPYQLAGKLTTFSKSISTVLLPEISYGNQKDKIDFNQSINFYTLIMPILLLLIFPFLEKFLTFWLKDQFSYQILDLTKIFLVVAWLSGISHILITYFEGKKQIKYSTLLELYLIIPFLIVLFIALFKFKSLIYISFLLFAKEILLLLFRTQKIKKKINNLFTMYSIIFVVSINLIISLKYDEYFLYSYMGLFIISGFVFLKENKIIGFN